MWDRLRIVDKLHVQFVEELGGEWKESTEDAWRERRAVFVLDGSEGEIDLENAEVVECRDCRDADCESGLLLELGFELVQVLRETQGCGFL